MTRIPLTLLNKYFSPPLFHSGFSDYFISYLSVFPIIRLGHSSKNRQKEEENKFFLCNKEIVISFPRRCTNRIFPLWSSEQKRREKRVRRSAYFGFSLSLRTGGKERGGGTNIPRSIKKRRKKWSNLSNKNPTLRRIEFRQQSLECFLNL